MFNKKIEILEGQKGTLRLLVHLDDKDETNQQRITDETNLYASILRSSVKLLKASGLVKTRVDNSSYPPKNMISLTDKGRRVAKLLKEIEAVLEAKTND